MYSVRVNLISLEAESDLVLTLGGHSHSSGFLLVCFLVIVDGIKWYIFLFLSKGLIVKDFSQYDLSVCVERPSSTLFHKM